MQKGFVPVIVLIGILVIVAVAGGAYYFFKVKTPVQKACTMDAKICPDGSSVGRSGPNCEFAPCPSPNKTDDETANWKTYTSTKANYSFKYPSAWPLKISTDLLPQNVEGVYFNNNDKSNSADYTTAVIEVSKQSINDYIKNQDSIIDIKDTTVGGKQAISYKRSGGMPQLPIIEYAVNNNKLTYIIRLLNSVETNKNRDENIKIFNQIISTFKFLK